MKEVNHFLNNITLIHPNSSTKATENFEGKATSES